MRPATGILVALAALAGSVPALAADDDFALDSTRWNGTHHLSVEAHALGCEMRAVDSVDWAALDARDVLWFVYPRSVIDPERLRRWLAVGGSVVIADDFGAADEALGALSLRRIAPQSSSAADRYDDNPALPISRPVLKSALGRSAPFVVANHPAAFASALPPTFALGSDALVIEGHYGKGTFVAVADPSLFINNMLEIDENLAFARALVRQSCAAAGRGARILFVTQGFSSRGQPPRVLPGEAAARLDSGHLAGEAARAASDVNAGLQRALGNPVGRSLVALLLAIGASALLVGLFPPVRRLGRFVRAQFHDARGDSVTGGLRDFGAAMAILREEVEGRLAPLVGTIPLEPAAATRVVQLTQARLGPLAAVAGELWRQLGKIRWHRVQGELIPDEPISRRRLALLHSLAVRVFAAVETTS